MTNEYQDDIAAIRDTIDELFQAISWTPDSPPDWERFKIHCMAEALLIPSARPASTTALAPFIEMMQKQRDDGNLQHFQEQTLGHEVQVFGNIAVALSAFSATINQGDSNRGVNAFLFVRSQDRWRIAAMAWDNESEGRRVPDYLI